MRDTWRTRAVVAACAVAALLAGGCGGPAPAAAPVLPTPTATPAHPTTVGQLVFPVDAYQLTPLQAAQREYVTLRLAQRCMAPFGYAYPPGLTTGWVDRSVRAYTALRSRLFGVTDPAAAAAYGYHVPSWVSGSPASGTRLPAAEQAVLSGSTKSHAGRRVPAGGCQGQALDELHRAQVRHGASGPDGNGGGALAGAIDQRAFASAQADKRVRAAYAAWSTCMRAYGYRYASPLDAVGDPRWNPAEPAAPAEKQTATRDVGCQRRVGLLGTEYAVMVGDENAAIARNARTLSAWRPDLAAERAAIAQLLTAVA